MAEPAGKLILPIVQNNCSSVTCPYRYGDAVHSDKLVTKINEKLKYRVADGNEVRALRKRVTELERALNIIIEVGENRKLNNQEMTKYKKIAENKNK